MESQDDTRKLVAAILSGQTNLFRSIIDSYSRLVASVVYRMVRNETDRQDLCQEVFVKVYRNLDKFQFEAKMSTWIAQIAYNTTINFLEKKKLPLWADLSGGEDDTVEPAASGESSPESLAVFKDISGMLQAQIDELPIHYKVILSMFHQHELTYDEIGKITGLPEGTVKTQLFRARKLLKTRLLAKYSKEDLCH